MIEELHNLIYTNLVMQSPVLSGNMKANISSMKLGEICISGPAYDLKKWKKDKVIVHTGGPDYANEVNISGAFGRHNKSEHWVNRVLFDSVSVIANEIGAIVINELPL